WANISFIALVLIGYYFFWRMYENQIHQKDLIERLLQKQQIQLDYYKKVSFYEKEFRKIKHDLKNQLLISESLKDKELIEEYRKEIDNLFSAYETKIHSGNEILDVLLENKIQYCKENNIEFKLNVNFNRGTFIDLIDVGTIFGNIIDNAIEACIRMETGKKQICLFVYESGNFIIIKMENTFDKIKLKGKSLVSLKENGKNHGIGLYSLEQTLNKYDGSYRYNADNGNFRLMILIPIQASN
ncbi:MAG: ATP-binding protein, partial [Eubacteriales bacterium]|nr:ATP-binding protein [Eubacteriales bacterium]